MADLRRWRDEASIVLVLAGLAVGLALGGWAWRLDRVVYDLGLGLWTRPPPADITIVAIDDASVDVIGRWPWRRAVHATLLERLAQARPKAVALDLVLSEADPDAEQDRLLARALAQASPVVVPVAWAAATTGALVAGRPAPMVALEPAEPMRQAVRLGAVESAVDADGVLRHAFLSAGPADAPYPHLALALLQAVGEPVHARVRAESGPLGGGVHAIGVDRAGARAGQGPAAERSGWARDGRLLIRYAGPPGTFERLSYVDVLRGVVPVQRLAGRYLLVGMTAQGLGDTLATPVNAQHKAMPGIEVLANTLYTLRSGDTLDVLDERVAAALAALALCALVMSFVRYGPRAALPTALLSVPVAVLGSLLSLRAGLWFSPVPYALPALLAYPLWSWRRLERAVAGLDREITRLDAEHLGQPSSMGAEPPPREPSVGLAAGQATVPQVPRRGDEVEARLRSLRRAGMLVRQARQFLADALAAMPTAMLIGDERARVVLANPKAAALFEVESADELQGLDLQRLLGELATPEPFDWSAAIATLAPGGQGLAVEARLADVGDFVVHVAAVDLQGQRRLIVTLADLAPVKQAQREREEALAFVSHDLRSPASAIVLLADLQLHGETCTPQDELLRELRRLAARTLALSEDFVRAAQAQSQPLQRAAVPLAELVEAALADLRAQATAAGVALSAPACTVEVMLNVDRALVVRAIGNLVGNAIRHSPRGAAVEVDAAVETARACIRVRDHGQGLDAAQLAQIARGGEGAAVRDARGVGLGLLFVQRVARRHAGGLRAATPAAGCGALFELELPR